MTERRETQNVKRGALYLIQRRGLGWDWTSEPFEIHSAADGTGRTVARER
jgi:hypothetical protein